MLILIMNLQNILKRLIINNKCFYLTYLQKSFDIINLILPQLATHQ